MCANGTMVDKVVQADHQVLVKVSLMVGVVSGLGLAYKNGLHTVKWHCNHFCMERLVLNITKEAHTR